MGKMYRFFINVTNLSNWAEKNSAWFKLNYSHLNLYKLYIIGWYLDLYLLFGKFTPILIQVIPILVCLFIGQTTHRSSLAMNDMFINLLRPSDAYMRQ